MTQDLRHSCICTLVLIDLVLQGRFDSRPKRHIFGPQDRLHELGVVEIVVVPQTQRRDQALQDERLVVQGAEGLGGVHAGWLVAGVDVESFTLDAWSGEEVEDADLLDQTAVLAGREAVVCLIIRVESGGDCWCASCRTNESCEILVSLLGC